MQNWFITGVGSGLGRALATALLEEGNQVFGTVRSLDAVADLRTKFPETFFSEVLDVSDIAAIRPIVESAFEKTGRFDAIVNNAGYGLFGAAEAVSDQQIQHQINTNLLAPIEVTRAAIPYLRRQGNGNLIAISSYGGQATHAGASLYHATKWGLEGFFDAMAKELAPFGLGVMIVEPGAARTGFRAAAAEQLAVNLDAYRDTPIGNLKSVLSDPSRVPNGDPDRMARSIISHASGEAMPLRLVLGSDAAGIIEAALTSRLDAVRAQAEEASHTDFPKP